VQQSTIRRMPAVIALCCAVAATAVMVVVSTLVSAADAPGADAAQGPQPVEERTVRIVWVGDTMFGSATASPPGDGDALFARVRPGLRAADLTFGNLEGVLATGGQGKCGAQPSINCFAFRASPRYARGLRRAGFDVINLANNHAWDYGATGQAETITALRSQRLAYTGLPGRITVLRRNGLRVAFVGFAPYRWSASLLDIPAAAALIRTAARRADVVVAAMHAGAEGSGRIHTPYGREVAFGEDRGDTRAFAHAAIDAGADLVVGSGPHVVRGIERHRGRLIAYSLGNFAGWRNFALGGVLSLTGLLDVTLDASGRPLEGRIASMVSVPPGIPGPDPAHATARLMDGLSKADFGARAMNLSPSGRMTPDARSGDTWVPGTPLP
jgi:Bacterial capsule synthesis protein PGA_cap